MGFGFRNIGGHPKRVGFLDALMGVYREIEQNIKVTT